MNRLAEYALLFVLAAGVLAGLQATVMAQDTGTTYEWWGPTAIGDGFHIRVPVTVTNPTDVPIENAPVAAEIDIGARLKEAGWVSRPSGQRRVLEGFALDSNSVRVVPMTNLEPMRGTDGRLRVHDPSKEGLARYEAPSLVMRGPLRSGAAHPFHPSTNPEITVYWRAPEQIDPGETRHYVVYFDNEAVHPPKQSPGYEGVEKGELESLFGPGPATRIYGRLPSMEDRPNHLTIVGLHDGTQVQISVREGGQYRPLDRPDEGPNPFTVDKHQSKRIALSLGSPVLFRIRATGPQGEQPRPVVALADGSGFVPATDGGFVGEEFILRAEREDFQGSDEDAIYFTAAGRHQSRTRIRVEPLDGGSNPTEFTLNADEAAPHSSKHPFTIGGRSEGFTGPGASPPCAPTARDLPAPGLYRATVTSGGPVLAQIQPTRLTPIPTVAGAPSGERFMTAAGWSDRDDSGGSCSSDHRMGDWLAIGNHDGLDVNFHTPTTAKRTAKDIGEGPLHISRPSPRDIDVSVPGFRDRPIRFESSGPLRLFAGSNPGGSVPPVVGPLMGSNGGRSFVGLGPTTVIAPFPGTEVDSELTYFDSTLNANRTLQLRGGGVVSFEDKSAQGGAGRLYGAGIESNKPIFAYPSDRRPTFLAGVPVFLEADPGQAMYRGYLLDIRSPRGLDPVTNSAKVNTSTTYELQVRNLARDASGGPVADTVELDLSMPDRVSRNWSAELDRRTLSLEPAEEKTVHLTVKPSADVPADRRAPISVEVTSRGNRKVQDSITTITHLQRSFDVGLWFDTVEGAKERRQITSQGNGTEFRLVVQNRGTVTDTIRFPALSPRPGWDQVLRHDGKPVDELTLDPRELVPLTLQIRPPEDQADASLFTDVTAQSTSSPAARARVTAVTKVRAPSDLSLETPLSRRFVRPGEEAQFPILLRNAGDGTAGVEFEMQADAPPNWSKPQVFVKGPSGRVQLPKVSIEPGTTHNVTVGITPPTTATARDTATVRFTARIPGTGTTLEALLRTNVRAVHRLEPVVTPPLPIDVEEPGEEVTTPVRLVNNGNLEETLDAELANRPSGWGIDLPPRVTIPRNATQEMSASIQVPPNAPEGRYNVTLVFISQDGNRTHVALPVDLGKLPGVQLNAPEMRRVQPGGSFQLPVTVENVGNVPLRASARTPPEEGWTLGDAGPWTISPGANETLPIPWDVPADASPGRSHHGMVVSFEALPGGSPITREVRFETEVGRPDLAIPSARSFRGAAGTLVQAQVTNDGTRPAQDLEVALFAGEEAVDRVVLGQLPPDESANVTLLASGEEEALLRVVADPSNEITEIQENDNTAKPTPVLTEAQPLPGPSMVLIVLILVGVGAWVPSRQ